MTTRPRSSSFAHVDEHQASGRLSTVLHQHDVLLGGSSLGKGLKTAAQHYLLTQNSAVTAKSQPEEGFYHDPNNENEVLTDYGRNLPPEDAFYVVDLGIVVSQVYQCESTTSYTESMYLSKYMHVSSYSHSIFLFLFLTYIFINEKGARRFPASNPFMPSSAIPIPYC